MPFEQELVQLLHLFDVAIESGHCVFINTFLPSATENNQKTITVQISNENVNKFRHILLNELAFIHNFPE